MLTRMPIANRGDQRRQAVAAQPDCMLRTAHPSDFNPMEQSHV